MIPPLPHFPGGPNPASSDIFQRWSMRVGESSSYANGVSRPFLDLRSTVCSDWASSGCGD